MFKVWSSFIQKFGVNLIQTGHQQNENRGKAPAPRRRADCAPRAAPVHRRSSASAPLRAARGRAPPEACAARAPRTPTRPCPRRLESAPATPSYARVRHGPPVRRRHRHRTRAARAAVARRELLAPSPVVTKGECAYKSHPFLPSARHPLRATRHCRRRCELASPLALTAGQPLP
jgi:hypothetical protein